MKKPILTAVLATFAASAFAQAVNDDVKIGATPAYGTQVWYSLDNDEQGSAPKDNWDLAFDVRAITSSIHINTTTGTMLWTYPKADISGWGGTIDTNGLAATVARYNSDTSWSLGAMGAYANPSDATDLDWGKYNLSTHTVTGDSIYIIKLANGNYKKLAIESLISGTFTFKYANLDGSNPQSKTIVKGNFQNKNFAYYSIQNDAALPATREPDASKWDLVFTQYTAFIPIPYNVTGVLLNRGVEAVKVSNLPNKTTYKDWGAHNFTTPMNIIGYNWKTFNGSAYDIKDSTVYFVKALNDDIWKIIFTGFSSSDGKMSFSKEKIWSVSVNDAAGKVKASVAAYPNPSNGQPVTVVYNFETNYNTAHVSVMDMTGKMVHVNSLETTAGLHQHTLPVSAFAPGVYIISVETDTDRVQQKLIVH